VLLRNPGRNAAPNSRARNKEPRRKQRDIIKRTSSEIVGWVEVQSAETDRGERWVSLTLNPSYKNSQRSKLREISRAEIKAFAPPAAFFNLSTLLRF
jgi:hypothetical protein